MTVQTQVQGTTIALAIDADGPLVGVVLIGPSGTGKTAAAISAIEHCPYQRTALVADDVSCLSSDGTALWAAAPPALDGHAELRGAGPALIRSIPAVTLRLAVNGSPTERMVDPAALTPFGEQGPNVPCFSLAGFSGLITLARSVLAGHSPGTTVDYTGG